MTRIRRAAPGVGGRFDVWAPRAERVDLVVGDQAIPLQEADGGWWTSPESVDISGAEIDYGYRLNGDDQVLPDPRGRRQPGGVHERSRTFDPGARHWQDGHWTGRQLAGGLIYELHVGTFTPEGTLAAAGRRLDHLVELGVTHVELLPVNGFNGEHNWGYDGVAWFTVHEPYGGPGAYQEFVDACHAAGLAVIQDVVYNHLGPSGNYLPQFGPYLQDERSNTWGSSVNLDGTDSDEVRRYILDNALMWLDDYHVDGLRLDAVHALSDQRAVHILEELAAEVDALSAHLGRPLTLIAESDMNDPVLITPREAGGYGLSAQWSDDFHHVLHVALTGETAGYYEDFDSLAAMAKVLTRAFFHDGTLSTFRGRRHGRPVDVHRTAGWRFVVFAQDHDQIGNRAVGDRMSATLDIDALTLGATLLFTSPFTPMLFMGEEWGAKTPWQFFTSHPEPELAQATAQGRLAEFERMGWDPDDVPNPQDPETFARSHLDWAERDNVEQARLLDAYRQLARLRRHHPDLTDPSLVNVMVDINEHDRTLLMRRGALLIAANLDDDVRQVLLADPAGAGRGDAAPTGRDERGVERVPEVLFASRDGVQASAGRVSLPPRSAAVLAG